MYYEDDMCIVSTRDTKLERSSDANKSYCINLFGGPGISKSTTAAGVFNILKNESIETELVTEFAKDATYEKRHATLNNQFYVTAKQHHRIWRVIDYWKKKNIKNGFIITDSPFILGLTYLKEEDKDKRAVKYFKKFLIREFESFNNINILLKRKKVYNPNGRNQTEEEAREIDNKIKNLLIENNIDFIEIDGDKTAPQEIVKIVKDKIRDEEYEEYEEHEEHEGPKLKLMGDEAQKVLRDDAKNKLKRIKNSIKKLKNGEDIETVSMRPVRSVIPPKTYSPMENEWFLNFLKAEEARLKKQLKQSKENK